MKKSTVIIAVVLLVTFIITLASFHWIMGVIAFLILGLPVVLGFRDAFTDNKPGVTKKIQKTDDDAKSNTVNTAAWAFGTTLAVGLSIVLTIWSQANGVLAILATIPLFPILSGFIEALATGGQPGHYQSRRYVDEGRYEPESAMKRSVKRAGRTAAFTAAGFAAGYKAAKKTEL